MGISDTFTYLVSLEFKVPIVRLATGCVSQRRDGRYYCTVTYSWNIHLTLERTNEPTNQRTTVTKFNFYQYSASSV